MFHTILVPLDGSPEAELALQPARSLAQAFGAELRLVTVEQMPDQPAPSEWDLTLGEYFDKNREETQRKLERLADSLRAENLKVSTSLVTLGPPVPRLLEEAHECKADLIVIFSHGRQGLSRLFKGSVAEQLTRNAPCPVMLIHQQTKSRQANGGA